MLVVSMTESASKSLERLESPVEVFVTGTGTSLEFLDLRGVLGVTDGTHVILVDAVGNDLLAGRYSTLQSIRRSKHGKVIGRSPFRAFDPHALVILN